MTLVVDADKPLSDLPPDLDIPNTKGWGYVKFGNDHYAIEHVQPDGSAHIYEIPLTIGRIIERERAKGAEEARREIRAALGL